MHINLNTALSSPNTAVEATPDTTVKLSPEVVVEQLRTVRTQIADVTPLSPEQRILLRRRANTSNAILQASINVVGALDNVAQAIGRPAADVRDMQNESNRWTAVEDELRTLLNGVSGANLDRRQQLTLIAAQAYSIGTQLARDPANAVLMPHVQEIKRLKSFERRKKTAPVPQGPPAPVPTAPAPHQVLDLPGEPEVVK
jgi:hypothetical protein